MFSINPWLIVSVPIIIVAECFLILKLKPSKKKLMIACWLSLLLPVIAFFVAYILLISGVSSYPDPTHTEILVGAFFLAAGAGITSLIILLPIWIVLGIFTFKLPSYGEAKEEGIRVKGIGIETDESKYTGKTSMGLDENVMGFLCYVLIWLSGLFFILVEKENKFVRFHAIQSIVVFGVLSIASLIPYIWIVSFTVSFILWIILMAKAAQGIQYKLPWIGTLSKKWVRLGIK